MVRIPTARMLILIPFALVVIVRLTLANQGQTSVEHTKCDEFLLSFALEPSRQDRLSLSCGVFEVNGPRKAYPDLHEYLSDQRPLYRCFSTDGAAEFRLFHREACWKVERVLENGATEEVACLKSWAVSPLTLTTASPKLKDTLTVEPCRNGKNLSVFHLTDNDRIRRAYTSFYVKFARDPHAGQDFFYGVSSRYFAWFHQGVWFFSAHWKNVGGGDYARMQCAGDDKGKPSNKDCFRMGDDLATWDKVNVSLISGDVIRNSDVHHALIVQRNHRRSMHEFTLLNGLKMPLFGLGTGAMQPDLTLDALRTAKHLKYGLVDTAAAYENEDIVGNVHPFRNGQRPLIQTKVWPTELGYQRTIRSVMRSRVKLGMPILDVVLLHWPRCYSEWNVDWMDCSSADADDNGELWLDSWRALERLYAEGFVLAIGVSNFYAELMKKAIDETAATVPMLVQNEFHLGHLDLEVVRLCRETGILYQGYALFRQGFTADQLEILKHAMEEDKWPGDDERAYLAQLVLRARGVGFLARSTNSKHLEDNLRMVERELLVTRSVFDVFPDGARGFDKEDL